MDKTFTLTLDGTEYEIEVHGNTFMVNEHPYVIGLEGNEVTVDGIAYSVELEEQKAIVGGIAYEFEVSGLTARAPAGPAKAPPPSEAGTGAIQAIMPGSVVQVLASEGDLVSEGDVVLILEAMKMENELHAPIDGAVKAIHVQAGQAVERGAVLAEIEPVQEEEPA